MQCDGMAYLGLGMGRQIFLFYLYTKQFSGTASMLWMDERNEFALLFRHSVNGVLPLTVHGCSSLVKTPIFSHGSGDNSSPEILIGVCGYKVRIETISQILVLRVFQ
jgi:hypothetical protein